MKKLEDGSLNIAVAGVFVAVFFIIVLEYIFPQLRQC